MQFALHFMERAGGVPLPQQISQDPAIKAAYQELSVVFAGGVTRPTRKAPQVPLYFMACFEDFVICEAQPLYWRLFSWYRLVRIWGTVRFDDHTGLMPASMRLISGSLRGTLVRTKTSGAGKKREELYLHIDVTALFFHPSWLRVGWELWQALGTRRDYFFTGALM